MGEGIFKTEHGQLVKAVKFQNKEIRGHVSHETYEFLLDIWGAKGLDKSEGLRDMASMYISHSGNLQLTERSEQIKASAFKISVEEVRLKNKGAYQARERSRRSRLKYKPGEEG